MDQELINTAYHEAGHAVFAALLSVQFKYVTIKPADGSLGHLRHLSPKSKALENIDVQVPLWVRAYIERRVMISLAGGLAAEKFENDAKTATGIEMDYLQAVELASYIAPAIEEAEAYVGWLSVRSRLLLDVPVHWVMVQSVAEALLVHSRLSSRQVKAIMAKCWEV